MEQTLDAVGLFRADRQVTVRLGVSQIWLRRLTMHNAGYKVTNLDLNYKKM
ncbi:hypothetical protein TUMEXPCC7403_19125 [Tumidithrix helvetica PCC 7403]